VTQAAKDRKRALADKAAVDELEDVKIGRGAEIVTISRDVAGLTRDEKLGIHFRIFLP
jgi:hypothetical protein